MAVAQKFLRHSDVRLTIHTYGHLDVEDVREGLSRSFSTGPVQVRTAGGLRERSEANGSAKLRTGGTAANEAQAPVASADSGDEPARTRARTALTSASARIEPGAIARVSPECTERQAADFVGAGDPPGSHAMHSEAPDRDAWTAGGLRAGATPLPAPGAELFIRAGAIVAERALSDAGSRVAVEAILRHASDQAAAAHR